MPKANDTRETPPELFAELNREFSFTLDAAANHDNALCDLYYTEEGLFSRGDGPRVNQLSEEDGLSGSWEGERVWCNPPFSDLPLWVEKAHSEFMTKIPRSTRAELIVMLIPAVRTEQPFWQEFVEPYRDQGLGLTTRFLANRRHFLVNGQPILNKKTGKRSSPEFGVVLLIWR